MYNEQPKKDLTMSVILGVQPHSGTYMAKHSGSTAIKTMDPAPRARVGRVTGNKHIILFGLSIQVIASHGILGQ